MSALIITYTRNYIPNEEAMLLPLLRRHATTAKPALFTALAMLITLGLFVGGTPAPVTAQVAPALAYGTFLGGASDDVANAVATDAQGNMYIAGYTYSNPFPGTAGSGPYTSAFVTKLDPTGTQVIYSTLMGGTNDEEALAIAVDAQGNAWVTGFTESDDLPTIRALRESLLGDRDTFLTKLAPNGDIFFQTYLGWSGSDQGNAIALDQQGNAYLAGEMAGAFGTQVRVAKVTANGSSDVYDVVFGGATRGFAKGSKASAIAVDAQGNAYLAGKTNTGAFDTGGFQDRCVGFANEIDDCPSDDGFVVVLNAAGNGLVGGTILGGLQNDEATGVALDNNGNIYVTGTTFSDGFPTRNPWQAAKAGTTSFADSFLVKLAPLASEMVYGTYYGGDSYDEAHGVAVDSMGRAYLTGMTSSGDLPVPAAFQPAITGQCITGETRRLCYDAFVASFDAAGALSWGSFIGGTDDDLGKSITVGLSGDVYLVGRADSLSLPTTQGALQPQRRGFDDAFLMRVSTQGVAPSPTPTPDAPPQEHRLFLPLVGR